MPRKHFNVNSFALSADSMPREFQETKYYIVPAQIANITTNTFGISITVMFRFIVVLAVLAAALAGAPNAKVGV